MKKLLLKAPYSKAVILLLEGLIDTMGSSHATVADCYNAMETKDALNRELAATVLKPELRFTRPAKIGDWNATWLMDIQRLQLYKPGLIESIDVLLIFDSTWAPISLSVHKCGWLRVEEMWYAELRLFLKKELLYIVLDGLDDVLTSR